MSDLSAEIATQQEQKGARLSVYDTLQVMAPEFEKALPASIPLDRFMRVAVTTLRKSPQLQTCTMESLMGALLTSAQLGLEVGPLDHFYLTPRRIKGTWTVVPLIGYKGIVELARRSGQLLSIVARPVYERDHFEYEYGLNEMLVHRPTLEDERGPVVSYYGVAKFKDGGHAMEVMSRADVIKRRDRGSAGESGPWATDFDAMACKTVIRQMQRWLPQTPELALAAQVDEQPVEWKAESVA